MPPAKRRAPASTVIPLDPDARIRVDIDALDSATQEVVEALAPFVGGLRTTFVRQWPAVGVEQGRPGHFTRTYPFPECWPVHPDLVTEFTLLRRWTAWIESGEMELRDYGGETDRWLRHVRDVTVAMVREISQLCVTSGTTKHVDPSRPRPGAGRTSHPFAAAPRAPLGWGSRSSSPQPERGLG